MGEHTSTPSLPEAFTERLHEIAGEVGCQHVLSSIRDPRPLSVRVQGDEQVRDVVHAELDAGGFAPEVVPWYQWAFRLHGGDRSSVQETEAFANGYLWIQSLSSMAAVLGLSIEPGHDVLDLCAAPGSKTTLISQLQQGSGILVANDRSRQRLFKLRAHLRQLGVSNAEVTCHPGAIFGSSHVDCFDRVLVDAPCSGEGMLHASDPQSIARWSEGRIRRLARQQAGLLSAALRTLRIGGCCMYSTCTYAPEENEVVVDRVLRKHGDRFVLQVLPESVPAGSPGLARWGEREFDSTLQHSLRLLPGKGSGLTGFYLALIRRVG